MKNVFVIAMLGLTMMFFGANVVGAQMSDDMGAVTGADMQEDMSDMADMPAMSGGMMNCGMMAGAMGGGMTGSMPCGMAGGCGMMRQMGPGMMGKGMAGCQGCGMMGGEMMGRGMGRGMMGGSMMYHHGMMRMFMGLGLDEKQKEAVAQIRDKTMKEMIRKRADRQIAMLELREILAKEPVDMKAAEAKLKQIESVRTDIFMNFVRAREEMKAKLTPDQIKKLKGMQEEGCGMMGQMPGGMMQKMPEMKEHEGMEHHHGEK